MKRIAFIFSVVSLLTLAASAQTFRAGVHAGVDIARLSFSGATGGNLLNNKNELTAGFSVETDISSVFGVRLEGNYSQQGVGVVNADGSSVASYGFDYITVPVLAKLNATPRLNFVAGPQVGFLIKAKQRALNNGSTDVKDQFESTDIYAVFGGGYRFDNGVTIDARYHLGTQNLAKDIPGTTLKNIYFSLRLGYSFNLGK